MTTAFFLAKALEAAEQGATVVVPAGVHVGTARVTKAVTLRGEPGAVLDGGGTGVLRISAPEATVTLQGLTLRNGVAEAGGLVHHDEGRLEVLDCTLERGVAHDFGGGALFSTGDALLIRRCRFHNNQGRQGGAILLTGVVEARITDSLFSQNASLQGGALRARDGVELELVGCSFVDNRGVAEGKVTAPGASLWLSGTTSHRPTVTLRACLFRAHVDSVSGDLFNDATVPASLVVEQSVLTPRDASFLKPGSVAVAANVGSDGKPVEVGPLRIVEPAVFRAAGCTTDLAGKLRATTAGAFEG